MASRQDDKPQSALANHDLHVVKAEIGKQVICALGQPRNFHSLQVRWLWEGRYRVNVFVGTDLASAKVAHSYFLVADSEGKVIASNPTIIKKY